MFDYPEKTQKGVLKTCRFLTAFECPNQFKRMRNLPTHLHSPHVLVGAVCDPQVCVAVKLGAACAKPCYSNPALTILGSAVTFAKTVFISVSPVSSKRTITFDHAFLYRASNLFFRNRVVNYGIVLNCQGASPNIGGTELETGKISQKRRVS